MNDLVYDNIEIAPAEVVIRAARDFAAAVAESQQFKDFEHAAERFRQNQTAQQALGAYQEKQIAWRALLMLNALSAEQKAELENLHSAFINQPVVQEYFQAQIELATLCQALGDTLSESIGLNYSAACGVSCCG
jgi:cell fate (sporulation/competence/biofilm development) regulator YlbF (YheA/YmcA/DUF963 family)